MLDLSKYYSNSKNDSNFKRTFSVEEVKASQNNQDFRIVPSKKKEGKFFFACGQVRGYVAANTAAKLAAKQPTGTIVVSEVVTEAGDMLLMAHEQNVAYAVAVF